LSLISEPSFKAETGLVSLADRSEDGEDKFAANTNNEQLEIPHHEKLFKA